MNGNPRTNQALFVQDDSNVLMWTIDNTYLADQFEENLEVLITATNVVGQESVEASFLLKIINCEQQPIDSEQPSIPDIYVRASSGVLTFNMADHGWDTSEYTQYCSGKRYGLRYYHPTTSDALFDLSDELDCTAGGHPDVETVDQAWRD